MKNTFQVADLGNAKQIIRVKNCSGWYEPDWQGYWSPEDTNWANVSNESRRELDREAFHERGFWMGYQGLSQIFRYHRYLSHQPRRG